MRFFRLIAILSLIPLHAEGRYLSRPNPLCDEHLVVIRPDTLVLPDGQPLELVKQEGAVFEGKAAPVTSVLTASVRVRFKGRYTLWVRAGGVEGAQVPLRVELLRGDTPVFTSIINDGPGSAKRGGLKAYEAYLRRAVKDAPSGAVVTDAGVAGEYDLDDLGEQPKDRAEGEEDPFESFSDEVRTETGEKWISVHRVDARTKAGLYWWRVGDAELAPGAYRLRVSPVDPRPRLKPPLVDAGLLTTYSKLVYPFFADISARRASYIRFRIDQLPESGVQIRTAITTHALINSTPSVNLNPTGLDPKEVQAHTETGYTPWYCLQDIERAPGLGFGELQLHVTVLCPREPSAEIRGATQFAMYPYADHVVREFDWNEPDGRHINIVMDFDRWRQFLKTFRDCGRDYYEWALENADEQLFPMTRPGLYLGGSGGGATDAMLDYVCKTLRLLGYNLIGGRCGQIECRNRYGWGSFAGAPRMQWYMPFTDEQASIRKYEEEYAHLRNRAEFHTGCPIWQMADEPGEGLRYAMSSPLLRYEEDENGESKYVDYPGYAGLNTRKTDYHDCALEGRIARPGGNIRILVAIDNSEKPTRYAFWTLGKVLPYRTAKENLLAGREGLEGKNEVKYDPKATLGADFTPFKIVYEGEKAALFFKDELIHEHTGLPRQGGFGFDGGAKALADLRIRPIRRTEHLVKPEAKAGGDLAAGTEAPDTGDDEVLDTLDKREEKDLPDWAKPKPLKQFVREDGVITGGYPEAHEGFRQWVKTKGVTPELFGKQEWSEVSPLTLDHLIQDKYDARLFYWSRQYSAYLTPKMFSLAAEAIRRASPNKSVLSYIGLAGGYLNVFDCTVMDMFQLAAYDNGLMPGVSDWYTAAAESQQVNAYSAAIFNAGARRYGEPPASPSMMHLVHPSPLRVHACLGNAVKYLSYYNFGPYVLGVGGDNWSHKPECYEACGPPDNRVAQVDDLFIPAVPRPSRVALLWSQANDHWDQRTSFVDKRTTFLALSHEYYQPDLVTEAQVMEGALGHYDALYVLETHVVAEVQRLIGEWVTAGGLLWTCADALTKNEYHEPEDLLEQFCGLKRTFPEVEADKQPAPDPPEVAPIAGEADFRAHKVVAKGMPEKIGFAPARTRARYRDGRPAWLEWAKGKGRVVYVAHRAGETYASRVIPWLPRIWPETGRSVLTKPLHEAKVERELSLSEPLIMANALSTPDGTVVVLFNMHPTPREGVEVSLREPVKPHSVETFDRLALKPLPYEYRDGRIHMALPNLDGGQMIVVRRRPAPPDDRLEVERKRTKGLLASNEPMDLAAGAWSAGFHPEWQMAGKIIPLVNHERWEVRRSAAEALGRLKHTAAGDAIAAALAKEADAHAKGDQIVALTKLRHPKAREYCVALMSDRRIFVKRQAMRAAKALLADATGKELPLEGERRAFAERVAELALQEPDVRVMKHGMELLLRLDPLRGLDAALASCPYDYIYEPHLTHWARALAQNDAAFEAYLDRGLPGGLYFLLVLAKHCRHPKLAAALITHLDSITRDDRRVWGEALVYQRDRALARKVLEDRDELPLIAHAIPAILEYAFEAGLGNDLGHWRAWLEEHGE